jgi:uncharacterized surface protein with fasciclin (FAS1) repeats
MKKLIKITNTLLLTGVVFIASSCLKDFTEPTPADSALKTITQVAVGNDNFTILVAALKKTNLASFLDNNNAGNFTVFAPTDAAFIAYFNSLTAAQLPPGSAPPGTFVDEASVLAAINLVAVFYIPASTTAMTINSLSSVLTNHIVSSKMTSSAITGNQTVTTLGTISINNTPFSTRLSISKNSIGVILNASSNVTAVDALASNGVVHTIDKVVVSPTGNASPIGVFGLSVNYAVSPIAISGGSETGGDATGTDYDILAYAIRIAGLAPILAPNITPLPDVTIFAPTDNAFRAYLGDVTAASAATENAAIQLLKVRPVAELVDILKYHVVAGRVLSTDLATGQQVSTLLTGKSFTILNAGPPATINDLNTAVVAPASDATISSANILTVAGAVHQINAVLKSN